MGLGNANVLAIRALPPQQQLLMVAVGKLLGETPRSARPACLPASGCRHLPAIVCIYQHLGGHRRLQRRVPTFAGCWPGSGSSAGCRPVCSALRQCRRDAQQPRRQAAPARPHGGAGQQPQGGRRQRGSWQGTCRLHVSHQQRRQPEEVSGHRGGVCWRGGGAGCAVRGCRLLPCAVCCCAQGVEAEPGACTSS